MPNPLARCITVAGSLPAGVILFRLVYWLPKSKIKDDAGKIWVAFSRARWMEETSLSADQYKKGLAQLGKRGLVEVKVQLFKGKTTPFVTLTEKGHWCVSAPRSVLIGTNGWCVSAPTNILRIFSEIKDSEIKVVSSVTSHAEKKQGSHAGPGKGGTMIRLPPKKNPKEVKTRAHAKSVFDVAATVKANKMLHKPDTVLGLSFLWKNLLHEFYGAIATVLTKKELGMLKHFLKKCPPGSAENVMTVALRDWIKFAKTVEEQAGIKTSPTMPKLEFLLTYAGVAVNLAIKSPKNPPLKQEADPGMVSHDNLQLIAKSNSPEKKSGQAGDGEVKDLDHLLSILNEDD